MHEPSPAAKAAAEEIHFTDWHRHGDTGQAVRHDIACLIDRHFLPMANEIMRLHQLVSEQAAALRWAREIINEHETSAVERGEW